MGKKIITISREYGSGGRQVGLTVAKKLGMEFYDKELIDAAAKEIGFPTAVSYTHLANTEKPFISEDSLNAAIIAETTVIIVESAAGIRMRSVTV